MKVRNAGVERGALCMLMIFPLLCPTAKGRFKRSQCWEDGKLNMSKDSHIFWHAVKTCPTPGGHHEGAVLLQTSFSSSVSEGEETATLQQFLDSCGTRKVPRCLWRKGFGFHMGWVKERPQSSIMHGDNLHHHLSWISLVLQLGNTLH